MISLLVTDANRDATFSRRANQSARLTLSSVLVFTNWIYILVKYGWVRYWSFYIVLNCMAVWIYELLLHLNTVK